MPDLPVPVPSGGGDSIEAERIQEINHDAISKAREWVRDFKAVREHETQLIKGESADSDPAITSGEPPLLAKAATTQR